jgi:hypothetical protein
MDLTALFLLVALVVVMCMVVVACPQTTRNANFSSERAKKKVRWADDVIFNGT